MMGQHGSQSSRTLPKQSAASAFHLLISLGLIQGLLQCFLLSACISACIPATHAFILPAVDNTSTLLNLTKINEKQLSFSELYPNLASLHQLLTSSIEYSSGQQYVPASSPTATTESSEASSATTASSTDPTTDDLLSKDKSIINIKFIKRLPRKLEIHRQRRKADYLRDTALNFDAAYLVQHWNNCTVKFKSHVKAKESGELFVHNHHELVKTNYSRSIHVQIEGIDCVQLPIRQLRPYANNITSLVVTRTGISRLEKFTFGVGALLKLEQLFLHSNDRLAYLKSRTFDGLSVLSYLSIINNDKLGRLDADAFAGIKNLEELIYIGNGAESWSHDQLSYLVKVASSRILPNLVHFHLSRSRAPTDLDEDENEFALMRRHYSDFFVESNSTLLERTKAKEAKKPNAGIKINKHDLMLIDQVKYLQLEDCQIAYIHQDAFEPLLNNLVQLSLAYNPLINPANLKQILRQFFVTNPNLSALKYTKKQRSLYSKLSKETAQDADGEPVGELADKFNSINGQINSQMNNQINQNQSDQPSFYSSFLPGGLSGSFATNNLTYPLTSPQFNTVNSPIAQPEHIHNQPANSTTGGRTPFGLESLDLSGVLTTLHVPKDLLIAISKTTIKQLYLRNLFWRELQAGDLPPLPNIQALHLEYSFIESIDENVFNFCENLVSLSLRGNLLSTIPLNVLEPLTKLERLDLSGYKSEEPDALFYRKFTFERKTFVFGTNLKSLILAHKNLEILERKIFIGLFKLESLSLRHANLKYVEYLTFFSLKSIVRIDLSANPLLVYNIRLSEEDTFVGLEAIEEVNLSGCNITDQDLNDQNLFKRMKENMRTLDLSHNQISKLDAQTFLDFNELRSVNLAHNRIGSWNTKIFAKQNFITSLDVSHNRLTDITPSILADFRRLKRLGFSNNPLVCDCKWKGSILWLDNDNKQKKILNKLNNNHEIQEHLESLVSRQQQIVTTVYASTDLPPPKSILDWLEYSNAEFLNEQHPLRSASYYCHMKDAYADVNDTLEEAGGLNSSVSLGAFVNNYCLNSLFINGSFKFTMLIVIVTSLMLLTTFCLMIALVYNSTLRNLITMVDEDFIHHYDYDAFVSYNFNDSDWVLNYLVPSLEDLPGDQTSSGSKIHFSSIYPDNDQYNLRTWIRSKGNKRSGAKGQKEDCMLNKMEGNRASNCNNNCNVNNSNENANRIKLCVYERDFIAGKQISECITESIRNSRKVILVISKHFAQSPWCRFETDLAHHTLVDQNRDGLILIKLEEDLNSEFLEKTAPQLHFLLKTRIYLQWSSNKREQAIFWKKLHSALGFKTHNGTYQQIRHMYQSYCTNHKPDVKRRHSVVLAPTQSELDPNNNVLDALNRNLIDSKAYDQGDLVLEQAPYKIKQAAVQQSAFRKKEAEANKSEGDDLAKDKINDKKEKFNRNEPDRVDGLQLTEIISEKLCRNLNHLNNAKLNEDQRIELRNLNQLISSYGERKRGLKLSFIF